MGKKSYINSICYEIELTAKYLKLMGAQFFDNIDMGISPDEFAALDTLVNNPDICQRDLAKMILKDRANTGKLLSSLEKKGIIERIVTTKNNRLVKTMLITNFGKTLYENIIEIIKPKFMMFEEKLGTQKEELKEVLKNFRKIVSEMIETQI